MSKLDVTPCLNLCEGEGCLVIETASNLQLASDTKQAHSHSKGRDCSRKPCSCTEWAGKAAWNWGGAAAQRIGKPPKSPLSPQDAYALYLQSIVAVLPAGKGTAEASEEDLTVLKARHRAEILKGSPAELSSAMVSPCVPGPVHELSG